MRILVITPIGRDSARSGGAETYIFELAKELALRTNVEVTVVTSGGGIERADSSTSKLRVERLSRGLFAFPLLLLLRARRYVRSADLVIENVSKFPLIVPAVLSRIARRPFVAVVHHIHGRTLLMELPPLPALLLLLYEYVSLFVYSLLGVPVVTVSKASEAELRRLGFSDTYVVPPALANPESDGSTPRRSKRPILVYVGRVKKYKRLDHFVKACEHVAREVPDVLCLVAGKGDEKLEARLRRLASRLGIGGQVRIFVGNLSDNLKLEILRRAWLYVFTSAKEGFGISVMEAMSQGVPVVAYDIPAMRELISPCGSGALAKSGDVDSLARRCVEMLKDEGLLRAASVRARECAKTYSYEVFLKKFLSSVKSSLRIAA